MALHSYCKLCCWRHWSKHMTMFPEVVPKTLCRQFHCLSHFVKYLVTNTCKVFLSIAHSHWEKYLLHWYEVYILDIQSLPLLFCPLPTHTSKHAKRFSTLATDHKGTVQLSTKCLLCRHIQSLHREHLIHWIWITSTKTRIVLAHWYKEIRTIYSHQIGVPNTLTKQFFPLYISRSKRDS